MVSVLANGADKTYTCSVGAPCSGSGPYGTNAAPQVTYVNGDFNFGNASGAGVLVVTGTLNITGNSSFNGLILVIGQGSLSESGGGTNGIQFNSCWANIGNTMHYLVVASREEMY